MNAANKISATMRPTIRPATGQETEKVAGILCEAAHWLEQSGMGA
jgi:hypothetical protein